MFLPHQTDHLSVRSTSVLQINSNFNSSNWSIR